MKVAPALASLPFILCIPTAQAQPLGCVDYARYSHWESGINQAFQCLAASDWYLYGKDHGPP